MRVEDVVGAAEELQRDRAGVQDLLGDGEIDHDPRESACQRLRHVPPEIVGLHRPPEALVPVVGEGGVDPVDVPDIGVQRVAEVDQLRSARSGRRS